MDFLELREGTLDIAEAFKLVTDPSCGAVASFVGKTWLFAEFQNLERFQNDASPPGTTRDNFDGRQVESLEYEAYVPMARSELQKVCVELRRRFPAVVRIAIFHRLG